MREKLKVFASTNKSRIKDVYWFMVFGIYSIIGYPKFMDKNNLGIGDILKILIMLSIPILIYHICLKTFKMQSWSWILKMKPLAIFKRCLSIFWRILVSFGYLVNYEFTNNDLYMYLLPVYIIIGFELVERIILINTAVKKIPRGDMTRRA